VVEDVAGRYKVDASTVQKWEKKHRVAAEFFANYIRDFEAMHEDLIRDIESRRQD